MRLAWVLTLLLASFTGCAPTTPKLAVRPATAEEATRLTEAMTPLLQVLAIRRVDDCRVGMMVIESRVINAVIVGRRKGPPCTLFSVGATQGMLRKFSVPMLRAALAHELAHWLLGHTAERADRGGAGGIFTPITRAFDREQEAEADRLAVELLRQLEPRYPGSCVALVYVFAMLGEQPSGRGWLSNHPSPEHRADAALAACNSSAVGRD